MTSLIKSLLIYIFLIISPKSYSALNYDVNGYGTVGVVYLDDGAINEQNATPYNLFDEGIQYDVDSRFGVQGNVNHSNGLGFTSQLVTLGSEDYDVKLEWVYLHFNYSNNLTIRTGRLRRPLYLHSDYWRIGYIYQWARLPNEIYSEDISFAGSVDAFDVIYRFNMARWDVNAEIYYGETSGGELSIGESYSTQDDYGLVVEAENDWMFFRLGYHRSPNADIEPLEGVQFLLDGLEFAGFSSVANDLITTGLDIEFYNFATGINYNSWFVNTEFVSYHVSRSLAPRDTSWYLNAGKRFNRFTAHLSYSERRRRIKDTFSAPVYTQIEQLTPLAGNPVIDATILGLTDLAQGVGSAVENIKSKHQSYTFGLRYDFDKPMSLKFEYQHTHERDKDLKSNLFSITFDFVFDGVK